MAQDNEDAARHLDLPAAEESSQDLDQDDELLEAEERGRTSGIFLVPNASAVAESGPGEAGPSRDQSRSRRKRAVRARTLSLRRTSKVEQALARAQSEAPPAPVEGEERPATRAQCEQGIRPCPYVSCKHHLYLDVSPRTGAIKLNFPDLEVWELEETCALDVAEREGTTLEEAGVIMNLTRERVRQLEVSSLAKLARLPQVAELPEGEGPVGKRKLPLLDARSRRLHNMLPAAPVAPATVLVIPRHDNTPREFHAADDAAFDVEAFAADDLAEPPCSEDDSLRLGICG